MCITVGAAACVNFAYRNAGPPPAKPFPYFQLAGFLINVASVSLPGRFDSEVDPKNMAFPWPTLFSPAGFAFAIWGVIYMGEVAGLVVLATNPELASAAEPASRAWFCANVA